MKHCPHCDKTRVGIQTIPFCSLGWFQAYICYKCDERYFTQESLIKMDKKAKERGLFGRTKRRAYR